MATIDGMRIESRIGDPIAQSDASISESDGVYTLSNFTQLYNIAIGKYIIRFELEISGDYS